jgi:hypothetical protein
MRGEIYANSPNLQDNRIIYKYHYIVFLIKPRKSMKKKTLEQQDHTLLVPMGSDRKVFQAI